MRDQTEHDLREIERARDLPPDEAPDHARSQTRCDQCGSSDVRYDERIHETFVYCLDCGAVL